MQPPALVVTSVYELPPRTWRQWWREFPGYYRITFRVVVIASLLHLALAFRIAIGLIESPEIRHLQQLNVEVYYYPCLPYPQSSYWRQWLHKYGLLAAYKKINDGFQGRSCRNVCSIIARGDLTDADIEFIANHFPNLSYFDVADVSATRFKCLERCAKISFLEIRRCDVEDAGLPDLSCFPHLQILELSETLASDAVIPQLKQLPKLHSADLMFTDVTYEAAIENWPDSRCSPQVENDPAIYPECRGTIRWSDGQRSAGFRGPAAVTMKHSDDLKSQSYDHLHRVMILWYPDSWNHGDGEYQLSLKLGEYESAPVTVTVEGGRPDVRKIEFIMPVTKAEALRSVRQ